MAAHESPASTATRHLATANDNNSEDESHPNHPSPQRTQDAAAAAEQEQTLHNTSMPQQQKQKQILSAAGGSLSSLAHTTPARKATTAQQKTTQQQQLQSPFDSDVQLVRQCVAMQLQDLWGGVENNSGKSDDSAGGSNHANAQEEEREDGEQRLYYRSSTPRLLQAQHCHPQTTKNTPGGSSNRTDAIVVNAPPTSSASASADVRDATIATAAGDVYFLQGTGGHGEFGAGPLSMQLGRSDNHHAGGAAAAVADLDVELVFTPDLYDFRREGGVKLHRARDVPSLQASRFVQIELAQSRALALTQQGVVYQWGRRFGSSLDENGTLTPRMVLHDDICSQPTLVPTVFRVARISCGEAHCIFVQDVSLHGWAMGSNTFGQCGVGHEKSIASPQRILAPSVHQDDFEEDAFDADALKPLRLRDAALGRHHTVVLTLEGSVFTWGRAKYGACGIVSENLRHIVRPRQLELDVEGWDRGVAAVAAGTNMGSALTNRGKTVVWGQVGNVFYARPQARSARAILPTVVETMSMLPSVSDEDKAGDGSIRHVEHFAAAGGYIAIADSAGTLFVWPKARSDYGFDGEGVGGLVPERLDKFVNGDRIVQLKCTPSQVVALTRGGRVISYRLFKRRARRSARQQDQDVRTRAVVTYLPLPTAFVADGPAAAADSNVIRSHEECLASFSIPIRFGRLDEESKDDEPVVFGDDDGPVDGGGDRGMDADHHFAGDGGDRGVASGATSQENDLLNESAAGAAANSAVQVPHAHTATTVLARSHRDGYGVLSISAYGEQVACVAETMPIGSLSSHSTNGGLSMRVPGASEGKGIVRAGGAFDLAGALCGDYGIFADLPLELRFEEISGRNSHLSVCLHRCIIMCRLGGAFMDVVHGKCDIAVVPQCGLGKRVQVWQGGVDMLRGVWTPRQRALCGEGCVADGTAASNRSVLSLELDDAGDDDERKGHAASTANVLPQQLDVRSGGYVLPLLIVWAYTNRLPCIEAKVLDDVLRVAAWLNIADLHAAVHAARLSVVNDGPVCQISVPPLLFAMPWWGERDRCTDSPFLSTCLFLSEVFLGGCFRPLLDISELSGNSAADVVLHVGGSSTFFGHRVILGHRSQYFRGVLMAQNEAVLGTVSPAADTEVSKNNVAVVNLPKCEPVPFAVCMLWIYTGRIVDRVLLDWALTERVLVHADRLAMPDLTDHCERLLFLQMSYLCDVAPDPRSDIALLNCFPQQFIESFRSPATKDMEDGFWSGYFHAPGSLFLRRCPAHAHMCARIHGRSTRALTHPMSAIVHDSAPLPVVHCTQFPQRASAASWLVMREHLCAGFMVEKPFDAAISAKHIWHLLRLARVLNVPRLRRMLLNSELAVYLPALLDDGAGINLYLNGASSVAHLHLFDVAAATSSASKQKKKNRGKKKKKTKTVPPVVPHPPASVESGVPTRPRKSSKTQRAGKMSQDSVYFVDAAAAMLAAASTSVTAAMAVGMSSSSLTSTSTSSAATTLITAPSGAQDLDSVSAVLAVAREGHVSSGALVDMTYAACSMSRQNRAADLSHASDFVVSKEDVARMKRPWTFVTAFDLIRTMFIIVALTMFFWRWTDKRSEAAPSYFVVMVVYCCGLLSSIGFHAALARHRIRFGLPWWQERQVTYQSKVLQSDLNTLNSLRQRLDAAVGPAFSDSAAAALHSRISEDSEVSMPSSPKDKDNDIERFHDVSGEYDAPEAAPALLDLMIEMEEGMLLSNADVGMTEITTPMKNAGKSQTDAELLAAGGTGDTVTTAHSAVSDDSENIRAEEKYTAGDDRVGSQSLLMRQNVTELLDCRAVVDAEMTEVRASVELLSKMEEAADNEGRSHLMRLALSLIERACLISMSILLGLYLDGGHDVDLGTVFIPIYVYDGILALLGTFIVLSAMRLNPIVRLRLAMEPLYCRVIHYVMYFISFVLQISFTKEGFYLFQSMLIAGRVVGWLGDVSWWAVFIPTEIFLVLIGSILILLYIIVIIIGVSMLVSSTVSEYVSLQWAEYRRRNEWLHKTFMTSLVLLHCMFIPVVVAFVFVAGRLEGTYDVSNMALYCSLVVMLVVQLGVTIQMHREKKSSWKHYFHLWRAGNQAEQQQQFMQGEGLIDGF